jgi:hypothetical protein
MGGQIEAQEFTRKNGAALGTMPCLGSTLLTGEKIPILAGGRDKTGLLGKFPPDGDRPIEFVYCLQDFQPKVGINPT